MSGWKETQFTTAEFRQRCGDSEKGVGMLEGGLREEEGSFQLEGLACRSPSPQWSCVCVCVCVCVRVCVCVAEAMVPPVMGHSGPDHGGPHEWMNLPGLLFSPLPAGMSQSLQPFLSKPT